MVYIGNRFCNVRRLINTVCFSLNSSGIPFVRAIGRTKDIANNGKNPKNHYFNNVK